MRELNELAVNAVNRLYDKSSVFNDVTLQTTELEYIQSENNFSFVYRANLKQ